MIFRSPFVLLIIILFTVNVTGQPTPITDYNTSEKLGKVLKKFIIVEIDAQNLYTRISSENFQNKINLNIGELVSLDIYPSHLISNNYKVHLATGIDRNTPIEDRVLPYKGTVSTVNNSDVRLTFGQEFIYGYIRMDNKVKFIEPLRYYEKTASKNLFIVYDVLDVKNNGGTCGVNEMNRKKVELTIQGKDKVVTGLCYELKLALASDYKMVEVYGSAAGVESHLIGVVNNVQGNFDDEFADELQFSLVEQWISDCSDCDPWSTSSDIGILLNSFSDWAFSGFTQNYDIATLWSDRDFEGSAIGLAWLGNICNNAPFQVISNFTTTGWGLRVLASHEMGHSFNASHDSNSSGTIMASLVNNTDIWSDVSITNIENFYNSIDCLTTCAGTAPVSNFEGNQTSICVENQVNFMDLSENSPSSWLWSFEGGDPLISTEQTPEVTYNIDGEFDVTLIVYNEWGTDTLVMENVIEVGKVPIANFSFDIDQLDVTLTDNSSGSYSLHWFLGDGEESTETSFVHHYNDEGNYEVVLISSNDCGQDTSIQNVSVVLTDVIIVGNKNKISLYPNPNNGIFYCDINGDYYGNVTVEIYSILGQPIDKYSFNKSADKLKISLDLRDFFNGTYILHVVMKDIVLNKKVSLQ